MAMNGLSRMVRLRRGLRLLMTGLALASHAAQAIAPESAPDLTMEDRAIKAITATQSP